MNTQINYSLGGTDMDFYMPTKVCQEKNAVKNHGAEIASFGKKALIVTGKSSSKKNHSLQVALHGQLDYLSADLYGQHIPGIYGYSHAAV